MTSEEQTCIQHLQKGIEYKRKGDYNSAINEYETAFDIYPYNKNIYGNLAKIFIGVGKQEYALRNLLIFSHLTLKYDEINMQSYDFASTFYDWFGMVDKRRINIDFLIYSVSCDFNISKIVSNINLTFMVGLSYLLKNQHLILENKIPGSLINNEINLYLGKPTEGMSLSSSEFSPMVRVIGLAFILNNLVTNTGITKKQITEIYLDKNYNLDNL